MRWQIVSIQNRTGNLEKVDVETKIFKNWFGKNGSKIQNLEIFQKSPNVVFSVKMTTFNFWGQSQFRSKGASKIILRILSGKAIRFFGYSLNMSICFLGILMPMPILRQICEMRPHTSIWSAHVHITFQLTLYSWTVFIERKKRAKSLLTFLFKV